MSKILEIKEVKNFKNDENAYGGYDGYKIKTETQDILIVISNYQSCCEDWGYITSNDNFEYFVGSELVKVEVVDSNMAVVDLDKNFSYGGDAIFVNVTTSLGVIQFVMYNEHNGYYGHDVLVMVGNDVQEFSV